MQMFNFWKKNDAVANRSPEGVIYYYANSVMDKNIFLDGEFEISKPMDNNDYSEFNYGINLVAGIFEEVAKDDLHLLKIAKEFFEEEKKRFADNFILSFSTNKNSRLLWENLNSNGYNIEFSEDLVADFANPIISSIRLGNVTLQSIDNIEFSSFACSYNAVLYELEEQRNLIREVVENIKNSYIANCPDTYYSQFDMLIKTIPYLKDPSLIDEQEFRLVIKLDENMYCDLDKIILKMNSKKYIKSITLGYTNSSDLSVQTMEDLISTLPEDIKIEINKTALRM